MLVGYMRVSSENDRQTTDLQRDALLAAGVEPRPLWTDQASGVRDDRPGLQQVLASVHPGDCLVVLTLARLVRILPPLLQRVLMPRYISPLSTPLMGCQELSPHSSRQCAWPAPG